MSPVERFASDVGARVGELVRKYRLTDGEAGQALLMLGVTLLSNTGTSDDDIREGVERFLKMSGQFSAFLKSRPS